MTRFSSDMQRYFGGTVNMIGENVTVRSAAKTYNDYGDATSPTNTDTTVKAIIQIMDASDDEVREGVLRVGDAIGFFKHSDYDYIKKEDDTDKQVYHQSVWYEITGLINEPISGNKIFCEAILKRI